MKIHIKNNKKIMIKYRVFIYKRIYENKSLNIEKNSKHFSKGKNGSFSMIATFSIKNFWRFQDLLKIDCLVLNAAFSNVSVISGRFLGKLPVLLVHLSCLFKVFRMIRAQIHPNYEEVNLYNYHCEWCMISEYIFKHCKDLKALWFIEELRFGSISPFTTLLSEVI